MTPIRSAATRFVVHALASVSFALPAVAASVDTGSLQGAWAHSSMECDQVFAAGRKGMSFRRPARIFSTAFIISGRRLITPGASCRIRSVTIVKERQELSLACATSVAVDPVTVQFSTAKDGSLYRYSNTEDTLGDLYKLCSP
jgi:hypothetical protein